MPTATIDSSGTSYFFTDSGPVAGSSDYTTLVIYHGTAFTGHTFHRLLPLVGTHNIRLVILNRRDYRGTSEHTDKEVDDALHGRRAFLEVLALDVAHFLAWTIDNLGVTKISEDGKLGGLAIMGWSMGSATTLSVLGNPAVIPLDVVAKLEPYFRKLVIYDSPHIAFGYDEPSGAYNPFTDPTFPTISDVLANFGVWVSGYYDNPDTSSRTLAGIDITSKHGLRSSLANFSHDELKVCLDGRAAARTDLGCAPYPPIQAMLREQAETALFDPGLAQSFLPRVEIAFIACLSANWYCTWGFFETERRYKNLVAAGKAVRMMRCIEMEGANHFVHWDDPASFLAATLDAVDIKETDGLGSRL